MIDSDPNASPPPTVRPPGSRPRGRPLEMTPDVVLERIRRLAARPEGLFRVHETQGALYARARRQFGSWSNAVRAAGVDYEDIVRSARVRSLAGRRRGGRSRRRRG